VQVALPDRVADPSTLRRWFRRWFDALRRVLWEAWNRVRSNKGALRLDVVPGTETRGLRPRAGERAARPFLAARLSCGSRAACARRSSRPVHQPSSDPVWSEKRVSIAGPPPPVVTNQQIQADPVSHRAGELSRLPRPSGRSPMTCDGIGSPVESQRADHRCTASNRTTVVHSPGWKRRAVFEVYLDLLARVSQRR